ncbi:MAG: hypothetical protein GY941_27915 [Planctomycetes bacterium]|nr:hypothetical protein [Planctomycetota bacterium]
MNNHNNYYVYTAAYFDQKHKPETKPYATNTMIISKHWLDSSNQFLEEVNEPYTEEDRHKLSTKDLPIGGRFLSTDSPTGVDKTKHQVLLESIRDTVKIFIDNPNIFNKSATGLINNFRICFIVNFSSVYKTFHNNIAPATRRYFAPVFDGYSIDKYMDYYCNGGMLDKHIANRDLVIEIIRLMIELQVAVNQINTEVIGKDLYDNLNTIPKFAAMLRKSKDEPYLKILEQRSRADALIPVGIKNFRRTKEDVIKMIENMKKQQNHSNVTAIR